MTGANEPADVVMRRRLARLTPAERLQMCSRMFSTAKALVLAGESGRYDVQNSAEMRRRLFLRFYGKEFTQKQTEDILRTIGIA